MVMKIAENQWTRVQKQFQQIGELLAIDPRLTAHLLEPERIVEVTLPLLRDNNTITQVKGVRVQHNSLRGHTKAASGIMSRCHLMK